MKKVLLPRALAATVIRGSTRHLVNLKDFLPVSGSKYEAYKSGFNTEMKQDRHSVVKHTEAKMSFC